MFGMQFPKKTCDIEIRPFLWPGCRSFIYLPNTLMAKNSTSIVAKLLLSANRVPRSFQEAFYFVVRTVLSTRVIGAVVTQLLRYKEIITQFAKSVDIL